MGKRSNPIALLLLLLALIVRVWAGGHARFTGDEAGLWSTAREVALGHASPKLGLAVTGSEARGPGPAIFYWMAFPQLFGSSPWLGTVFMALMHVLAGGVLWKLAEKARGARAGLVVLALFAVAPWEVLYADRIWSGNAGAVCATLMIACLVAAEKDRRFLAPFTFFLIFTFQIHMSVPVVWAGLVPILIFTRPPLLKGWPFIVLGVFLAALTYATWFSYELSTDFRNLKLIFARSGGNAELGSGPTLPLQVYGLGMLFSSSEIGFQFARGYWDWAGGFDPAQAYFSAAGWSRYFSLHGALLGSLGLISIALALLGWGFSLYGFGQRARVAWRTRARLELEDVITLALITGLASCAVLLLLAKKKFFPHYAILWMPTALWPVAMAIDRWLANPRLARLTLAALGLSLFAMLGNLIDYYREIDALNGMGPTLGMLTRVLDEPTPVSLRFEHFPNHYAWQRLAAVHFQRPLRLDERAPVRYVVHNRAAHQGPIPPGGTLYGPVLMVRTPPEGTTMGPLAWSEQNWRRFKVTLTRPDGSERSCVPDGRECKYGEQPWQHLGPDLLDFAGQAQSVLFMHPVEGAVVRCSMPRPSEAVRGKLRFGLSDQATKSSNQAPVELRFLVGDQLLFQALATNQPGLTTRSFALSATVAGDLSLEIRAANEGARVFGFDLRLD